MKLSRRDFIHAGVAGAISLTPQYARSGINNPGSSASSGNFSPSQRNVINVSFTFSDEYPWINSTILNTVNPTLNGASPFDGFSLNPFPQQIDQNGYINNSAASGQNVKGTLVSPASSNFSGPWVETFDGDGRLSFDTSLGGDTFTFTETNLVTPGTCTITIASPAVVSFANSFSAGQQVVFSTTGALPTGLSNNTVYYVSATGLSGSSFQVSATSGGASINTSGSQSGTHTLNGTYTRNGNGSWTNRAGIKPYVVFNLTGNTVPRSIGFAYTSTGGTPISISSYSWSGGTLTVNTSAHGRQAGTSLYLTFQGSSSSALANATLMATITSATQFTVQLAADPTPIVTPGTFTAFITNVKMYQQADEADMLAGKIFRSGWKQSLVNLNPSALRFMNWNGGNSGQAYSFLDRTLPASVNWNCGASSWNFGIGPAYGRTSGYTNWTVTGITTGIPSNPNTTPAFMTHGEIAQVQIGSGGSMGRGPQVTVTAIQKQNNPTVTTSGAHGLFAGDKIWFTVTSGMTQINGGTSTSTNRGSVTVASITDSTNFVITLDTTAYSTFTSGFFTRSCDAIAVGAAGVTKAVNAQITATNHGMSVGDQGILTGITTGMTLLNMLPFTVASLVDKDNFTTNLNTVGYPTFTSGSLQQYCTLQVGSGNDRVAYPLIFPFGSQAAAFSSSNNYMNYGSYKVFRFDKSIAGKTDGAGNYVLGAWVFSGNTQGYSNDVPIEVCVACVNELNAMSVAQGKNNPIHMMATIPPQGIDSTDSDQTSARRYGPNMVNVILNGANGYAGLTSAAHLFIEWSNEPWNLPGGVATYMVWRGQSRWPTQGGSNTIDMQLFRATAAARDIGIAFPSQTGNALGQRVHRVLGGPPNQGSAVNSTYWQYWFTGGNTTFYSTDATVVSGGWGAPGNFHEAINVASYVDNNSTYYGSGTTGTRTFNDDLALYSGTDNTGLGGGNYTGAANQTLAIQNFVDSCVAQGSSGPGFAYYLSLHTNVSGWIPNGKFSIEYEGGANWRTQSGGSTNGGQTISAAGQTFLLAILNSAAWGTAQKNYFNAVAALPGCAMCSVYTINSGNSSGDQRWCYAAPDSYASGTEGQALLNNGAWAAMSTRNQALTV